MTDIKICFDNFIGEYIWRMIKSGITKVDEIPDLIQNLRKQRLTSDLIEFDLAMELKNIVSMKYEDCIESNRLNSYGVPTKHIQLHMKNAVEFKLQQIVNTLKLPK